MLLSGPESLDQMKTASSAASTEHMDISADSIHAYLPSTCLRTVHTALGLPGSSDTAISDTYKKKEKRLQA